MFISAMRAADAAEKFNAAIPGTRWSPQDLALYDVTGTDGHGKVVWRGRVWLPMDGGASRAAAETYPEFRKCAAVMVERVSAEAQARVEEALEAGDWHPYGAKTSG